MAVIASDSFTYSNGDLATVASASWWKNHGNAISVVSNTAQLTGGGTTTVYHHKTSMGGPDHYAKVTVTAGVNADAGVIVRGQNITSPATTYYGAWVNDAGIIHCYRVIGSGYTEATGSPITPGTGSGTLELSAVGAQITVKWNGTTVINWTDPSPLTTGNYAGLQTNLFAGTTVAVMDNFEAGTAGALPITLTQMASTSNGEAASVSLTSASFTPTAGAKLYAFAVGEGDNHSAAHNWTCSGGSLTWTKLETSPMAPFNTNQTQYPLSTCLFEATVGGSPSSMTVTMNTGTGTGEMISLAVFQATSTGTISRVRTANAGSGIAASDTASGVSGALSVAATSGNTVVAMFGVAGDVAGACTQPSGWSTLTSQSQTYTHIGIFTKTDFTGTSVTCTDLGQQVGAYGSVILELTAAAGNTVSGSASSAAGGSTGDARAAKFADSFTRANGAVSGVNGWGNVSGRGGMSIVSNALSCTTAQWSMAMQSKQIGSGTEEIYAECTVSGYVQGNFPGLILGTTAAYTDGYHVAWGGSNEVFLTRRTAGGGTDIATATMAAGTAMAATKMRLSWRPSDGLLTFSVGGVAVTWTGDATDTTHAVKYAGVHNYWSAGTQPVMDNFIADTVLATNTVYGSADSVGGGSTGAAVRGPNQSVAYYSENDRYYTDAASLNGTTFTMAGFFYLHSIGAYYQAFLDLEPVASNTDWHTIVTGADGSTLWWSTAQGGVASRIIPGYFLQPGTWYFLATVFTTAAGGDTLYYGPMDSALTKSSTVTQGTGITGVTGTGWELHIGNARHGSPPEWLHGRMAGVKIWTAALTEAELNLERTSVFAKRTADLWGSYPFNTGPSTADASGNGHTLTAGGTPTAASGPSPASSTAYLGQTTEAVTDTTVSSITVNAPPGITGEADQKVFLALLWAQTSGGGVTLTPPSGFTAVGSQYVSTVLAPYGVTMYCQMFQSTTNQSAVSTFTVSGSVNSVVARLTAGVVNRTAGANTAAWAAAQYISVGDAPMAIPSITTTAANQLVMNWALTDIAHTINLPSGFTAAEVAGTDQPHFAISSMLQATAGATPTPTISGTGDVNTLLALTAGWVSASVSSSASSVGGGSTGEAVGFSPHAANSVGGGSTGNAVGVARISGTATSAGSGSTATAAGTVTRHVYPGSGTSAAPGSTGSATGTITPHVYPGAGTSVGPGGSGNAVGTASAHMVYATATSAAPGSVDTAAGTVSRHVYLGAAESTGGGGGGLASSSVIVSGTATSAASGSTGQAAGTVSRHVYFGTADSPGAGSTAAADGRITVKATANSVGGDSSGSAAGTATRHLFSGSADSAAGGSTGAATGKVIVQGTANSAGGGSVANVVATVKVYGSASSVAGGSTGEALSTAQRTFTDSFNRGNGAIGSEWETIPSCFLPTVFANHVIDPGEDTNCAARVVGMTGDIQLSAVTITLAADYSEGGAMTHVTSVTSAVMAVYTTDGTHPQFSGFGTIDGPAYQLYTLYNNGVMIANKAAPNATATRRILLYTNGNSDLQMWVDSVRELTGSDGGVIPHINPPGFTMHRGEATGGNVQADDYRAQTFVTAPPAPTIGSLSPVFDTGGTVTVTGTNFMVDATMVTMGGVDYPVTVSSATAGTFTAPAHAAGTVGVTLTSLGGTTSSSNLTYLLKIISGTAASVGGGSAGDAAGVATRHLTSGTADSVGGGSTGAAVGHQIAIGTASSVGLVATGAAVGVATPHQYLGTANSVGGGSFGSAAGQGTNPVVFGAANSVGGGSTGSVLITWSGSFVRIATGDKARLRMHDTQRASVRLPSGARL